VPKPQGTRGYFSFVIVQCSFLIGHLDDEITMTHLDKKTHAENQSKMKNEK